MAGYVLLNRWRAEQGLPVSLATEVKPEGAVASPLLRLATLLQANAAPGPDWCVPRRCMG
jgi:hypothetical protein